MSFVNSAVFVLFSVAQVYFVDCACNWGAYGGIPLVADVCQDFSSFYIMYDCDTDVVGIYGDDNCTSYTTGISSDGYSCDNSGSCDSLEVTIEYFYSEDDCSGDADDTWVLDVPKVTDVCINGTEITVGSSSVDIDYYTDSECSGSPYNDSSIDSGCESSNDGTSVKYTFKSGTSNLQSNNIILIAISGAAMIASLFI